MRRFKETTYKTYNEKIKKDIKILHISDIHYMNKKDNILLDRLYNKFKKIKLDYIFITGDIIENNESTIENGETLKNWLIKISNIAFVIISYGNHEKYRKEKKKYLTEFNEKYWNSINKLKNITIVNNSVYENKDLFVYGYTPSINYYYPKEDKYQMLKELNLLDVSSTASNKLNICLIHSPMYLDDFKLKDKIKNYDLILSGHMHNGLVPPILDEIFKSTRGIISRDLKLFPKMSRGYIKENNLIIISPGINKINSYVLFMFNWINIFFPIGYNIINVKNKKCKFTTLYKYTK